MHDGRTPAGAARQFAVGVFCGAHCDPTSELARAATQIGQRLAAAGVRIVYGGGHLGLMGALGAGALSRGGSLLAVIPEHLRVSEGVAFAPGVETMTTATLRERKQVIDRCSDAFLALPGGIGTLEELAEMITLRQIGVHSRPIWVFNPGKFWRPLQDLFESMNGAGLLCEDFAGHVTFLANVDAVAHAVSSAMVARPANEEAERAVATR